MWCHASGMQFVTLQECNFSRFRNAICHASGMQLKMCTLTLVYLIQHCSGASGLIVATTKLWWHWWERERAWSLAQKRKRRQRAQMQSQRLKSASRTMSARESRSALRSKLSAWSSWETTISSRSLRFETALTSSKLFQRSTYALPSHFHTSLHVPRLQTNLHVLVQRSWDSRARHTPRILTPSYKSCVSATSPQSIIVL